jgi:capsular exopolysaccharide synthesis family protein
MSRIFDALQRSGVEESGVEYPDVMSVAAAVFEIPRTDKLPNVVADEHVEPTAHGPRPQIVAADTVLEKTKPDLSFPSMEISVSPTSRLIFHTQPESLAAEKFRFLAIRLRGMRQSRSLKKVLITSTIPEEGKSTVSINLAGVLARRKERVLLIEGDLRRPVLAQELGLGRLAGLAEWLRGGLETPSNIYHLSALGFWILPAGTPPDNPLELIQSTKLSTLMANLATLFDWIVVDSPPLLPLADTTVWIRLTDGTLLVTRQGTTQKGPMQRGLEAIKKSELLGVILNGSTQPEHDYYYSRYSTPKK